MVSLRSMRVGVAVMTLWVFGVWMAWLPGSTHSAAPHSPPSSSAFISPALGVTESSTPPAFTILRPTTRRPVDAGSPSRPSKIRIELAYRGYATKQDITVTIGGRPATIINLVPVRYLIEVQAPQQPARGRYDLEVTIKGVTVREPGAVTYFGVDNVNIVLTIDRSGSMSIAKMAAAREAARQFVDLMQVGDGIGIVGFDDRAETPLELTPILEAPPPSAFLFSDGMEFGTEKWIADPPWSLTSVARNSAQAWTDSPAGNYANNVSSTLTIATPIVIPASMTAPALMFWHRYDIASSDRGDVLISNDGGASWQSVASFSGTVSNWRREAIRLDTYRGQSIRVRFRLRTDAFGVRDGWYIDDVAVGPVWDDVRARAQAAIDTLNSRGSTSIGGGLQRSQQMLDGASPDLPRAIVLLSDGQENTRPYVREVLPQIRAAQTAVHTIGLGRDADQRLMLSIAAQTGGTYNYAPTPDQLARIYNTISGAVSNRQTLVTANGNIAPGGVVTQEVTIDRSIAEATFWVSWTNTGARVTLTLQTPSGVSIDPGTPAANPDVRYVAGATYAYYRVRTPTLTPGVWRMRVSRAASASPAALEEGALSEGVIEDQLAPASTADEPFVVRAIARADLTLGFVTDKIEYLTTEPIVCFVTLADDAPITGATVLLSVQYPGQTMPFVVPMYDDGLHGDGEAGDGVYAALLIGPREPGTATFAVTASGSTSRDEPFVRQAELSTFIEANPDPYTLVHLPLIAR
ncbi:MAG: VWA domain-containing protein [Roseiflexaceae bacterium]|nr:VWA domain-containing protein [Roseiflexaceae bacterium]